MPWIEWGLLLFCVVLLIADLRLSKEIEADLAKYRPLSQLCQSDTARLDYLIEHDAGLTRDSIDAAMTWTGETYDEKGNVNG